LDDNEWFYPADEYDIKRRSNFHVIVIGSAGMNVPSSYFERIFNLAQERGRIGREARSEQVQHR
jgi:hypothetical protein